MSKDTKKIEKTNSSKKINDWHLIEFYTPISQFQEKKRESGEDDFLIQGVAINETTTLNGHKYIAEELAKAAPKLVGRKMIVDHEAKVSNIKGVITDAVWNSNDKRIDFEA